MSGTDIAYGATRLHRSTAREALSGTDIGYADTRSLALYSLVDATDAHGVSREHSVCIACA
eukprot:1022807-Rhodomonas_salina.1